MWKNIRLTEWGSPNESYTSTTVEYSANLLRAAYVLFGSGGTSTPVTGIEAVATKAEDAFKLPARFTSFVAILLCSMLLVLIGSRAPLPLEGNPSTARPFWLVIKPAASILKSPARV